MDYGDDDVPTRLLERRRGRSSNLTISAPLRLRAIGAMTSLTLAVGASGPRVAANEPANGSPPGAHHSSGGRGRAASRRFVNDVAVEPELLDRATNICLALPETTADDRHPPHQAPTGLALLDDWNQRSGRRAVAGRFRCPVRRGRAAQAISTGSGETQLTLGLGAARRTRAGNLAVDHLAARTSCTRETARSNGGLTKTTARWTPRSSR